MHIGINYVGQQWAKPILQYTSVKSFLNSNLCVIISPLVIKAGLPATTVSPVSTSSAGNKACRALFQHIQRLQLRRSCLVNVRCYRAHAGITSPSRCPAIPSSDPVMPCRVNRSAALRRRHDRAPWVSSFDFCPQAHPGRSKDRRSRPGW